MDIDVYAELNALEISLRSIISYTLREKYGARWVDHLNVSDDRKTRWQERHREESARLKNGALDARLLYYSDFHDLKPIIEKHWDDGFAQIFFDKRTITVYLEQIEQLRNASAHSRSLYEYQKLLIKGISWELRTRIMMYRGKKDDPSDYFPVIEHISDSLGFSMSNPKYGHILKSTGIRRVGDSVEITVHSIDPMGGILEYDIRRLGEKAPESWQLSPTCTITFTEKDIGTFTDINVKVRTQRSYHAMQGGYDAVATIRYEVLPNDPNDAP